MESHICPQCGGEVREVHPEETTECRECKRWWTPNLARIAYLEREVERLTAERDNFEASDRGIADNLVELAKGYDITPLHWDICPTELVVRIIDHLDERADKQNAALVEALESVANWLCDGPNAGDCNEKPVHREMLPRAAWCYSCVARAALAAAKGADAEGFMAKVIMHLIDDGRLTFKTSSLGAHIYLDKEFLGLYQTTPINTGGE